MNAPETKSQITIDAHWLTEASMLENGEAFRCDCGAFNGFHNQACWQCGARFRTEEEIVEQATTQLRQFLKTP